MLKTHKLIVLTLAIAVAAPLACGSTPTASPPTTATVAMAANGHEMVMPAAAAALLRTPPAGLVVLDVRTPDEFAAGHIAGALNFDLNGPTFESDLSNLDASAPYFVYCHSGHRSAQAVTVMEQHRFGSIYELQGGIEAWMNAGLQVVST